HTSIVRHTEAPALLKLEYRGFAIPPTQRQLTRDARLPLTKTKHHLAHLDPVAVIEHHRSALAFIRSERRPVHDHRVCRRQVLEAPPSRAHRGVPTVLAGDLQGHPGMRATHGRLTQLNVSIGRSLRPTKCHARPVRARRPNEPDLLAGVAPSDDLE